MQSRPAQPTQVDMGFSSITNVLAEISRNSTPGNSTLAGILGNTGKLNDIATDAMKAFRFDAITKANIFKNIETGQNKANEFLSAIFDTLQQIRDTASRPSNVVEHENFTTPVEAPRMLTSNYTTLILEVNKHLSDISLNGRNTIDALKNIIRQKGGKAPEKKHAATPEPASVGFSGAEDKTPKISFLTMLGDFAKSIVLIKANLTKAVIGNVSKFEGAFQKLLDLPKEKMASFSTGIKAFGDIMTKLTTQIRPSIRSIGLLSISMVALSLAVTNPLFALGLASIGLFVAVMQRLTNGKTMDKGILQFAQGVGILTIAMFAMQWISWEASAKLLVFMAGLGLALKTFTGDGLPKLFKFAESIGILTLSMAVMMFVDWSAGAKMILFIGGLGLALRAFGKNDIGKSMVSFGMGIGLLTLGLIAFNVVDFGSIFKMLFFIGGLGLVLRTFNMDQAGLKSPLLSFAFGLGLMVLAVLAFAEIPITAIFKTLAFIGLLGLELKLFNSGTSKSPMLMFAFGLGVMVLAMYAMQELPWEALGKTLLFIGGLGIVMKLFNGANGLSFLLIAGGILAISGALWVFKQIGWTMADALVFGGTITILGAIAAIAGIPAVAALIAVGSIALIAMGAGMLLVGLSILAISKLPIDYGNINQFAIATALLATTFAIITPLAAIGAVGAILFLPIAASALIASVALAIIAKIGSYDLASFAGGVRTLADVYASISFKAALGIVGAALFLPIAASALFGAVALKAISLLAFDQKSIDRYGVGMSALIGAYENLSLWQLAKGAAKAVLLVPILASGMAGALVLKGISELDVTESKVMSTSKLLGDFTNSIIDIIVVNKNKFTAALPGINALAKILSISSDLAKSISLMANMEFYEHEVRNGRLVLKSVRKIGPGDMKRVGENLALMLKSLIEPLTILGSDADTFLIGGQKIANPFKNPSTLKGIDMLAKVGGAFKPLIDSVSEFVKLEIASDSAKLELFTHSLMSVLNTIIWCIDKAGTINNDLAAKSISTISRFVHSIKDISTDGMASLNSVMEKFINNLVDDVKWKKIVSNMALLKNQISGIASAINSIDINKATLFEKNMHNFVEKNSAANLSKAVDSLREIFGLITDRQNQGQQSSAPEPAQQNGGILGFMNSPANTARKDDKPKNSNNTDDSKDMQDFFTEMLSSLSGIAGLLTGVNEKLSGTLKVMAKNGNPNMLF